MEHWVNKFGITKILTYNEQQFTSKHFKAICTQRGVKEIITAEYHPHANAQFERLNETILFTL